MMSCVLFRDTTVSSIMCPTPKQPKVLLLEAAHRSASIIALLTRAAFEVIQTQDADEAWATLDARDDVDVLLADIDIPSPVGGVDLGRYVHARWPGLGLVLTSGQVRHLRPDEIPGDGCFLPHPIPADTLLDEVRLAVRRY
jgi:DNA-binding NtrC family response regulator